MPPLWRHDRVARSRVEQASPAQPGVAPEPAIERDQLRALLEGERGQIAVGYEIAAQAEFAAEVGEARPMAGARTHDLSRRIEQRSDVLEHRVDRVRSDEDARIRRQPRKGNQRDIVDAERDRVTTRIVQKGARGAMVDVVGAKGGEEDVDVRQQQCGHPPRRAAKRWSPELSTAAYPHRWGRPAMGVASTLTPRVRRVASAARR